ncbi:DNA repair exonuclease SbcCD ATPase subunit [Dyadobacter sp. BE34]|uniref:DNA repair exonuclease SbcCD ATPase subunit n=1 Tax=Dyadobacter fermentans TaxID=94254 RepID=A0ABU1R4F6_9BACT|nr:MULTISPECIES: heavy metal-binding domain-containing protein [Dyadobacter]MDR6808297.1 DNA repair exonuclease SbcCD ATPase subunit [Dyadobacter fermentans]MDR7045887.1 DNA repair exonuclease SbcCD ATPase subunit [Dyadobacter sp. BE242]MDR7200200.1 DNA repair exonuclease SbcCD ATPase subunit [Dyadobacter sp. BE34]MDR7218160.1 DNA repair exonuclease SbcCD ATPase subunit [Dyadobacter sp. BE31]MDR7266091.1 DNA repair exonuclease SbcCD ATPase subunit [Dyadobacter sp. BE32]
MNKIIVASLLFLSVACSGNKSEKEAATTEAHAVSEKKYACPMKCEGEKTYAEAGKCPVCKMELQEVALAETDTTAHQH